MIGTTLPGTLWGELGSAAGPLVGHLLGSYRLVRPLGDGGMGVVFEAQEEPGGARVALKLLRAHGPQSVQQLKREFRQLAELRNDHLVPLYELHAAESAWFFTMELVDGTDFLRYVWQGEAPPEWSSGNVARLEEALRQLARGVQALHGAGLLHLDLKPSNVLVDRSGSVKVLDFGIARELYAPEPESAVRGTPAYMAPEQVRGENVGTSADWFAIGVMLHEALTGTRPLTAQASDTTRASSTTRASAATGDLELGWPALDRLPLAVGDLAALCRELLQPLPWERPGAERILACAHSGSGEARARAPAPRWLPRAAEAGELERYLAYAAAGHAGWIELEAASGMGKTSMLDTFTASARMRGACVLRGRCYERERAPFQGFDGVAAQLGKQLDALPASEQATFATDRQLAAFLFPELAGCNPASADAPDPHTARHQALSAFRRLFERLAARELIVLCLDDVHWADRDAALLIADLLAPPAPRHLLIVSARRSEEGASHPEQAYGTPVVPFRVSLAPLAPDTVQRFFEATLPALSHAERAQLVAEARGVPLFVQAIATRHTQGARTLEATLSAQIDGLPVSARELLEVLSVFGRPLPQRLALAVIGAEAARPQIVFALRHAALVATGGPLQDDPIELCHPWVAEVVARRLPAGVHARLVEQLTRVLENHRETVPELLAHQYRSLGDGARASAFARKAAEQASADGRPQRAVAWFERALAWTEDAHKALELRELTAVALVRGGRNAEAAAHYEGLAHALPARRAELVQAAAEALFTAGDIDGGLRVIAPQLRTLGTPLPTTTPQLTRGLLTQACRLARRALVARSGRTAQPAAREADGQAAEADGQAAEVYWAVAKGIGVVMPMHGLLFHLHSLQRAADAGEPRRIARGCAVLSATLVALGGPFEPLGAHLLAHAAEVAERLQDRYLTGLVLVFRALSEAARIESPRTIRGHAERGLELLRGAAPNASWECDVARSLALLAAHQLGLTHACERDARAWLSEANERGDPYAQLMAHHLTALSCLARGDLAATRAHAREPLTRWSRTSYTVPHYYAARLEIQALLSSGEISAGWDLLQSERGHWARAQLMRVSMSRLEILALEANLRLHLLHRGHDVSSHRQRARELGRMLGRDGRTLALAHRAQIDGALAASVGERRAATVQLERASALYEMLGYELAALCVRRRLAELADTAGALQAADERMAQAGITDPSSYTNIHCPPVLRP